MHVSSPGTTSCAKYRLIIFGIIEPKPHPQQQETTLAKAAHCAQIWMAVLATLAAFCKSRVWLAENDFCGKMKRFWKTFKKFAVPNHALHINNFVAGSFDKDFFGRWFRATMPSRGGSRAPPGPHGRQAAGNHTVIDMGSSEGIQLGERGRGYDDLLPAGRATPTHHLSPTPGTTRMRGNRRVGGSHSRSTSR